jgi:poly(A) polymerase
MLLDGLKNGPVELAMGCLLHDIAKPDTFERAPDRIRFHGHDKLGAEKSYDILKRLMFTNEQIEIICALVAEHLRFKDASQMRLSTLKRFLSLPRFDLHLELHRLDCLASHGDLKMYEFCKAKKAEFDAQPPPPLRLVTGQDLIQLGFLPGPYFSEVLRSVEDAILEGKVADKAQGIEWINAHFDKDKRKT